MEEAQKRIDEWMKDTSKELYLRKLDLISLPKIPYFEGVGCACAPPNCVKLNCSYNKLTTLPDLPSCQYLYCYNNQLTTLPDLPNCQELDCGNNQLTTLPDLPNCQELYCYNDQLAKLPDLPNCRKLCCSNNQLTKLPDLPNCQTLYCISNKLTTLPDLLNCNTLCCYGNQLTALPDLPKCQILYCHDNPYLHITKDQAKRFNLKETPNYTTMAIRLQRRFRQKKKYMFLKSLQRHINEFLARPNNYLYYLAKQRFEKLSTKI